MYRDPSFWLLKAIKDEWLPDNRYINNGLNEFPRVEVYLSSSGAQIDKGENSKPCDIVFDIITESLDAGEAMLMAENLQSDLIEYPIEVEYFNIDLAVMTGLTPVTEESPADDRTINRILVNYTYNLTQVNF